MNSDALLFIPFVNRLDLLSRAVQSVRRDVFVSVFDNSAEGLPDAMAHSVDRMCTPPWPMSASQSINAGLHMAQRSHYRYGLFMHSDAAALPGHIDELLRVCREATAAYRKWGVAFTNYDALCAFNLDILKDVGYWDTTLPQYFSDNDYYRRVRLAGYETIETNIPVIHDASSTINADPKLCHHNSVTFPLYLDYYIKKWGGEPGSEVFTTPFGVAG